MVFCVDTGKQLWAPHSSAPGSSWEPGSSTQDCANPHGMIPELSLASSPSRRAGTSTERTVLVTPIPQRGSGKGRAAGVFTDGKRFKHSLSVPGAKPRVFHPKATVENHPGAPALSRLSRLLALLLLLLEGSVVGFPLLSQFVGLGERDPRDLRAGQGPQPLGPTQAPGARGGWTPRHRDQG